MAYLWHSLTVCDYVLASALFCMFCFSLLLQKDASIPVTVTSSFGTTKSCFQNPYGIMALSAHGGSYPSTAYNTRGNTIPNDICMSVGVTAIGDTYNGYWQNGNGRDCPSTNTDWPNAAYNVNCFVSVWLK